MRRHKGDPPRQTRIVATLGLCPDNDWPTFLEKLSDAGTDVLRINFSHAGRNYEKEKNIVDWATQPVADRESPRVATLGDLQGPKARIGLLPEGGIQLKDGAEIVLHRQGSDAGDVPVPAKVFDAALRSLKKAINVEEDTQLAIVLGDGEIELRLQSVTDHSIVTTVAAGQCLTSRKGITIRGIDIDLEPFSKKDQRDLMFCLDNNVDMVAISFVRTAKDITRVRDFIEAHTGQRDSVPLIAKIETLAATQNIESIVDEADGIMIARGDLGLQLGVAQVPFVQKQLAKAAKGRGKPVIVATQMLESMIDNPTPTRAEATDVFNAILDGGDAVMLSGETSVGKRPFKVVQTMDRIARQAESYRREPEQLKRDRKTQRRVARRNVTDQFFGRINEEFALTAVQFAEHIPARAVVSFTRTGGTPRRLSQYRPGVPLFAICSNEVVARRLLIHFGVHPMVLRDYERTEPDFKALVTAARATLKKDYGMMPGDAIVVTAGVDWPTGGTNVIRVMVEDFDS